MIYDFTLKTGKGEDLNLADYKGKVILIVNTAISPAISSAVRPPEQMMRSMNSALFILTRPSLR